MFTIDADAWKYATATAEIQVPGYSRGEMEMEAMEQAADFFQCSREEIVLTAPSEFAVRESEGEYPFRPKTWHGTFKLAHISVEQRNMVLAKQGDEDDDED